jgi:murein DD-endopeptidase MepM/ murein hydrolase activator NlpD
MMTHYLKSETWMIAFKVALITVLLGIAQILNSIACAPVAEAQSGPIANKFSYPLGYQDGLSYGPKLTYDNQGVLIENTDYGIQNPDLKYTSPCFGMEMRQLFHAGEDWYRRDKLNTMGSEVTAIADGVVTFADRTMVYPGRVVIIRHTLPSAQIIYSVYAHLDYEGLAVDLGQTVYRGQRLGTVLDQVYDGRYPQYHPEGYDSHLHFEIRYFGDGTHIYEPQCAGSMPGRGYTYPDHPDDFPASGGYTDPNNFLISQGLGGFVPLLLNPPPTATPTRTGTPTRTSTRTNTPVFTYTPSRTPTRTPTRT